MIEPNENGPVESEKANEECRGSGRQKRPGKKKWKKVGKMEEEIFSHSSLSLLLRSLHSLSLLNVSPTFSPPYFLSLYNSLVASSAFKREREREATWVFSDWNVRGRGSKKGKLARVVWGPTGSFMYIPGN